MEIKLATRKIIFIYFKKKTILVIKKQGEFIWINIRFTEYLRKLRHFFTTKVCVCYTRFSKKRQKTALSDVTEKKNYYFIYRIFVQKISNKLYTTENIFRQKNIEENLCNNRKYILVLGTKQIPVIKIILTYKTFDVCLVSLIRYAKLHVCVDLVGKLQIFRSRHWSILIRTWRTT